MEQGYNGLLSGTDKKITVKQIIQSTELAKKYGIKVRYYMMLGNRGETAKTFQETLDFPGTVYGEPRGPDLMRRVMARQSAWFEAHRDDRAL